MSALGASLVMSLVTLLGGVMTILVNSRVRLPQLASLAAGVLLGIAFFDLLPRALSLAKDAGIARVLGVVVAGYLTCLFIEPAPPESNRSSLFAPTILSLHGLILGGFSARFVDVRFGLLLPILLRSFADGACTVAIREQTGRVWSWAEWLLLMVACAPVVGALLGQLVPANDRTCGAILSLSTGALVYLATSRLSAQGASRREFGWSSVLAGAGAAAIYAASLEGKFA